MIKSSKGLPANRESELRDALALILAGQRVLNMADGVTPEMVSCNARQAEFLSDAAHKRYREAVINPPRICRAERNLGFSYVEATAKRTAIHASQLSAYPVAVYEMAGTFHVYEGPQEIVGFGDCIATYRHGDLVE